MGPENSPMGVEMSSSGVFKKNCKVRYIYS
jgi:hypothetical protein